jgi:3-deoxy-D-glycero-D-galacto-nononate 9-phosphate synthase
MNKETYIIAEIGQNHNGDINLAKQLIDLAAMPIYDKFYNRKLKGVNAIKLTKRDLTEELTTDEFNKPYDTPNSFGKTYGEHRQNLELTYEQHVELINYARNKGLDVIETLCSPKCVSLTKMAKIDYIKIASRDLTNIPLLESIAKTNIPVILSTGMSDLSEIIIAIKTIEKYHSNISILHCLSQYPADYPNLNLLAIKTLKREFGGKYKIGYSDHSIGIVAPIVAVSLGAEIIEKHITLSHALKGSDQKGSLELDGLWRMTRDIRNAELSFGVAEKKKSSVIEDTMNKLKRSLATNSDLKKGVVLTEDMLCMLSPGTGLNWFEKDKIIGKKLNRDVSKNTLLQLNFFI